MHECPLAFHLINYAGPALKTEKEEVMMNSEGCLQREGDKLGSDLFVFRICTSFHESLKAVIYQVYGWPMKVCSRSTVAHLIFDRLG